MIEAVKPDKLAAFQTYVVRNGEVEDGILADFLKELGRAYKKFPRWPLHPTDQMAIVAEEAGEALTAALKYLYEGGAYEEIEKELIQTGAMALRALLYIRTMR